MAKVEVNGSNEEPLYGYLKKEKKQLGLGMIKWNFEKFLIGKDGKVLERFASTTTPEEIEKYVVKALEA
jgi:glutathione peroxidase